MLYEQKTNTDILSTAGMVFSRKNTNLSITIGTAKERRELR